MTLEQAADRLAIRELIDAYAHCADRRDAKGQMALFTENTAFHVFMDSRSPEPTYILRGRDALEPVFEDLNPSYTRLQGIRRALRKWLGYIS